MFARSTIRAICAWALAAALVILTPMLVRLTGYPRS